MLKLLTPDTSGIAPFPCVQNPMRDLLRGLKTCGGYSLEGKFPRLRLTAEDGFECAAGLGDYFTVGLLNVFSSKMKSALQCVGAELEFFPVDVQYNGEETTTKYFVGNLLRRIKGIDLSNSIVELDEEVGNALAVEKLVLDEGKFEGTKIAVVHEIQQIAVTEEVVAALHKAGCIGCAFVNASSVRY